MRRMESGNHDTDDLVLATKHRHAQQRRTPARRNSLSSKRKSRFTS